MFRNVFLVDITEHRGPDERAINSVRAHALECNAELVDWFKLPRQVEPQLPIKGSVFPGPETGLQLWPKIQQRIIELSTNGFSGAIFHVLSYSPYVLSEARKLNQPSTAIRTTPVPVLLTKWRLSLASSPMRSHPASQTLHWCSSPTLSLHDALELTKNVLKKHGHTTKQTALLRVQLRPLLAREDQRAKKDPLDRSSRYLIANVVAEGVRTGCIGAYNIDNIPGTERVWLVENGTAANSTTPITTETESQRTLVSTESTAILKPTVVPPTEIYKIADATPAPAQSPTKQTDKGRERTAEIVKTLKNTGVYTPKPQRDDLFRALRSCLPNGTQPKTILQLTREIRRAAETTSAISNFRFWHPATEGMVCMLLGAGVLLNETGQPIQNGPFAKGSQVSSFDEPLEDRCEAFLLETAITSLSDVTKRDRMALAHALFWDSTHNDIDRMEDRFEKIFSMLADRLVETDLGTWKIEPSQQDAES